MLLWMACANICMSPWFQFFGVYPEVELLNHVVTLYLMFWVTVFHSDWKIILYFHQLFTRVLISSHPDQHLLFFLFVCFNNGHPSEFDREGNGTPLQYSCLENPMDGGLVGCSPWGRKESNKTERLHFHALEKEMATHSSVLTWSIPGTGDPGGLPSTGSHRVGHNWSDLAAAVSVKWYLFVGLICISLMISDVEPVSLCLLTFAYPFWKNVYSSPLPTFWIGVIFVVIVVGL